MHVRRALALAAALPLLLVGCSEKKEPAPKMPDPSPSAASSSATPEATEEPEQESPEQESPEEFIRRWVAVGDEMQVTGKTAEYESMTHEACKACRDFVSAVQEIHAGGGKVEFAGASIDRISRREQHPPTFAVTKTLPKTVIRRGGGEAPETLPSGTTTLLVILHERQEAWAVKYYGVL